MEKEIGRIKKNDDTDIVIKMDDYGGKRGVTIREFITSERYTGFTKQGTKIPSEKWFEFRELVNTVDINEKDEGKGQEKEEKAEEEKAGDSESLL